MHGNLLQQQQQQQHLNRDMFWQQTLPKKQSHWLQPVCWCRAIDMLSIVASLFHIHLDSGSEIPVQLHETRHVPHLTVGAETQVCHFTWFTSEAFLTWSWQVITCLSCQSNKNSTTSTVSLQCRLMSSPADYRQLNLHYYKYANVFGLFGLTITCSLISLHTYA